MSGERSSADSSIRESKGVHPQARCSHAGARMYKKRTAAERVNSRLNVSVGFEEHFIRGLARMRLRCSLALCVILAMALGRI